VNLKHGLSPRRLKVPKLKTPPIYVGGFKVPTAAWLWTNYTFTPPQFQIMFDAQEGQCKLCHIKSRLFVDYDRRVKKVRGLLCIRCLRLLEMAQTPSRLLEGNRYLLKFYLASKQKQILFTELESLKKYWDEVQEGHLMQEPIA